jgi:hypothetical protein
MNAPTLAPDDLPARLDALDWPGLLGRLDASGYALTEPLLTPGECAALIALHGDDARFRKRIVMERFRYGAGDYAYFARPLPPLVSGLREALYGRLAPLANQWAERLTRGPSSTAAARLTRGSGSPAAERLTRGSASATRQPLRGAEAAPYPALLAEFLQRCHAAGQQRPTPLLLHYEAGGYNCLHQDLYGAVAFPLQATVFLSRPGADYRGGEFLLVEQRPRQQSRGTALVPEQGAILLFPSAERPVPSRRGFTRARMRHGVSTLSQGRRYTLGIIFHDAE